MNLRFVALALVGALSAVAFTQENTDALTARLRVQEEADKREAISLARLLGLPIRQEFPDGRVIELMKFRDGRPMYYTTCNKNAAITTRANLVYPGGGSGYALTGSTMTLGEWDAGSARSTHTEFGGRVTVMDAAASASHSTHVGGTLIAAGVDVNARGMSYQGHLKSWDWNSDTSEMNGSGLLVSNHSYGFITGWTNNGGTWYWYGDQSESEDRGFGMYDSSAQEWDVVANHNPNYLIFKAAGNDRGEGPSSQPLTHKEWNGSAWVNSTTVRQVDGGALGYDTLPYQANAKNIMTVGAVNDVLSYTGPASVVMSSFSGWGPTDDGRIKPDIVANGINLYSTNNTSDTAYTTMSGTSMATPNACGSAALIQQAAKSYYGSYLRSAALRGLIIHTALEAGSTPGPDYKFGWGLMNTEAACTLIRSDATVGNPYHWSRMRLDEYIRGSEVQDRKYHSAGGQIKVTICWNDPAGTPASPVMDSPTSMLVNDLDLTIIGPGGTYYPWRLDPANPALAATKGPNHRDNVEQVVIDGAVAGDYIVRVTAPAAVGASGQFYTTLTTNLTYVVPVYTGLATVPSTVQGGQPSSLKAVFDGPNYFTSTFALSSDTPAVATVPASMTAPVYSYNVSAPITTSPVLANTTVTLTADQSGSGPTRSATLLVTPGFQLYRLALNRSIMIGGETSLVATATMTSNAPSATTVALSDNTTALNSPASITVPSAANTGSVTIPSVAVTVETTTVVSASYLGVTKAAMVIVTPPPILLSVAMSPNSVHGGSPSTGTLTLDRRAPTGGLIVTLADDSANITVPSSVMVVGGLTTATFTAATTVVTISQTKTITAKYKTVTRTASLTLTP